jgi:hypothetical protein
VIDDVEGGTSNVSVKSEKIYIFKKCGLWCFKYFFFLRKNHPHYSLTNVYILN